MANNTSRKILTINSTIWLNELDQYHREDGPAYIHNHGIKVWYLNGKQHRVDGPAFEYPDGTKFWYYQGKQIDCQSQEEFERLIKLKAFW